MAIKEILDILGENPTESVYSEGKDFVTKKIKLYIDKKKLENYVKETYNRRTKVYASKKFAYEGFMVYISSKAFINEVKKQKEEAGEKVEVAVTEEASANEEKAE